MDFWCSIFNVWFFCCSFHVGSGAQSADAYAQALAAAKQVFIAAVSFGIKEK